MALSLHGGVRHHLYLHPHRGMQGKAPTPIQEPTSSKADHAANAQTTHSIQQGLTNHVAVILTNPMYGSSTDPEGTSQTTGGPVLDFGLQLPEYCVSPPSYEDLYPGKRTDQGETGIGEAEGEENDLTIE